MVKIGTLELDAKVYISSTQNSYNFSADYEYLDAIKQAFASASSIEFTIGPETLTLYSPILQIMQINGNVVTVIFTAAEMPENKTKALEKRARELEAKNAALEAQLADATGTIEADGEAIAELAAIVAEMMEG